LGCEAVTAEHDYDALLVVSFGGPEGPADVDSFLDNVFRGLRVPPETKAHIAKRYQQVGGVSPINAHTRAFIKALQLELDAHGPALPIYWGNRNWHPLLADTVAQMAHAGVRRALAFVTSSFSSYSGCRRYREDLYEAALGVPNAPRFDKLRVPFNHPGFIEATADRVNDALGSLPAAKRDGALVLFSAHSLPLGMLAARLPEQQRLVWAGAVARPGHQRRAEGSRGRRHRVRRRRADRLRLRSHGSHHGSRRRSGRHGARAQPHDGARRHGRHASRLRGDGARARRGTADAGGAAPGSWLARPKPRPLSRRLLPPRPPRAA
jgi:hypothetical protein